MVRKILAGLVLAVLWCSGALGATGVFSSHRSIVDFDGTPDYSTARFLSMWVEIVGDTQAAQADVNLTGSITFSGGSYSFWDGKNGMRTISGTPHTFGLASNMSVGDYLDYLPMTASGDNVVFCLGADGGLNGVNVSWNFPDNTSYNGQGIVPHYRTTQEQLESYVPYVEYVWNGSQVTGLRWRVVAPDNTSEAVTLDFASSFIVASVQNAAGNTLYSGQWAYIEAGDIVSGEVTFDSPINEADISRIRVAFNRWNEDSENSYQWYFCKPSTPQTYLYETYDVDASLVNGKSDYSNANFACLFFAVEAENVIVEAHHFMTEGSVMIPGGGYALGDNNVMGVENTPGKEIGVTIPVGTDRTFKLRMYRGVAPGDTFIEYQPIYDDGTNLEFRRGAETSFPGKVLTWTFPEYPSLNGSATVSSFKSTAQQLAEGVPYIELVSADGKLTAVKFRVVTSSDTSLAITPSYRTDFRLRFDRITPEVNGRYYWSSWMNDTSSGTWTLDNPQPLSNMDSITVRYRTWENPDKYIQYNWFFISASAAPDPAPSALTITTTSLPAATVSTAYTATLTANTSGVTWSVLSGTLPAGLTLNSSSGAITGTPTIAGTSTFTVRAVSGTQSAEKQLSITVNPINPTPVTALTITTTSLPAATPGTPYSTTLTANSSGVIWSLISGTLPAGLTLSSSGTISGTPTTAGSSSFTVRAVSGSQSAEKSLSITVNHPKGSVGSSGGGCEAFAGLSGLFVLVALFRKPHHSA